MSTPFYKGQNVSLLPGFLKQLSGIRYGKVRQCIGSVFSNICILRENSLKSREDDPGTAVGFYYTFLVITFCLITSIIKLLQYFKRKKKKKKNQNSPLHLQEMNGHSYTSLLHISAVRLVDLFHKGCMISPKDGMKRKEQQS